MAEHYYLILMWHKADICSQIRKYQVIIKNLKRKADALDDSISC